MVTIRTQGRFDGTCRFFPANPIFRAFSETHTLGGVGAACGCGADWVQAFAVPRSALADDAQRDCAVRAGGDARTGGILR